MLLELFCSRALAYTYGRSQDSLEAVVAAIKREKQEKDALEQRRSELIALLEADGLGEYAEQVDVDVYVQRGEGSAQQVVEECLALRRAEQEREQRCAWAAQLLAAEQLPASYLHGYWLPELRQYIDAGEGKEAAVAAVREEKVARAEHAIRVTAAAGGEAWQHTAVRGCKS